METMSEPKPKKVGNEVTPETIEFGRRVKAVRIRLGLTQIEAAEKLGIGNQGLYRIESGTSGAISLDRAYRIATAWGVDPAEIDERLASSAAVPKGVTSDGPGTLTVDLVATHAKGFHLEPATGQDRAFLERAGIPPDSLLPAVPYALLRLVGEGVRAFLVRFPGGNPAP